MPAGITRGCGKRQQAGAYLEVPTGPNGKPVEHFLCDPPYPIDKRETGISPIGVTLFPDKDKLVAPGVKLHHVLDWVGSDGYPNVADFVEEVRRFGVSRRIARTADFSGLGHGSKLYLAHSRAVIENYAEHYGKIIEPRSGICPKALPEHNGPDFPDECCAGLWWNDVEGGEWVVAEGRKMYRRFVGDTSYWGLPPAIPSYRLLGLFAIFPLAKIAVIRAKDRSHELTEHAASLGKLPVSLEDE